MKTWLQGVKDAEAFVRDYCALPLLENVPTSQYERGVRDYLRHIYSNRGTLKLFYSLSKADQAVVAKFCEPDKFRIHPAIVNIHKELQS